MFMPEDDGITHINIYSKGKTLLGRDLSNFTRSPFVFDQRLFASVEAWWYWHKAKQLGIDERAHLDELRLLHGFKAKKYGKQLVLHPVNDPSPAVLLAVYQAKADQNPRVKEGLRANKLPFDHYYVYNGRRQDTKHAWTGQLWSKVKV